MNRDKKSMCLVCKEMAVVVTPLLYANMVVHADHLNDDLLSTLSSPERHNGLPHIRTLRIEDGRSWEDHNDPDTSDFTAALCSLLRAIPENALSRFE
jgi:hypothetical protein